MNSLAKLKQISEEMKLNLESLEFAKFLDANDELKNLRDEFFYPKMNTLPRVNSDYIKFEEEECVYMCGHSLGLMPRRTPIIVQKELQKWAQMGVEGHAHGDLPWQSCDELVVDQTAKLVGAKSSEVCLMNSLTVNEHLLLISFYRPTETRFKILLERNAFPSDHYCIESQIKQRGLDPNKCMIYVETRQNEDYIRMDDIIQILNDEGPKISVILLPGVLFTTGQALDIQKITELGHKQGCYVGFDLAHAIGNVPLRLNEWGVDFACWCSYKYLCSGAGGIGGIFLSERFSKNDFPKLLGWWSHKFETRFLMTNELDLTPGAFGYRISNPAPLLVACLQAYLEVLDKTNYEKFRAKSKLLTTYMFYLLDTINASNKIKITIITPQNEEERGCQISVRVSESTMQLYLQMVARGVLIDKRGADILRLSANPLYNSFVDVHRTVSTLKDALGCVGLKSNIPAKTVFI